MTPNLADLSHALLDAARKAGADTADALAVSGTAVSIEIRKGALEQAERSEGVEIGLRVLIGRRQACVSASDTSAATITALAERAVAMAREAPEDATAGLAEASQLAQGWDLAGLDLADPAGEPGAAALEAAARAVEAAALALTARVVALVDMRRHRGLHPRVGALDVLPFVPLREALGLGPQTARVSYDQLIETRLIALVAAVQSGHLAGAGLDVVDCAAKVAGGVLRDFAREFAGLDALFFRNPLKGLVDA